MSCGHWAVNSPSLIFLSLSYFSELRSLDSRTRARDAAVIALGADVDKFEELHSNLKEGGEIGTLQALFFSLLVHTNDY